MTEIRGCYLLKEERVELKEGGVSVLFGLFVKFVVKK